MKQIWSSSVVYGQNHPLRDHFHTIVADTKKLLAPFEGWMPDMEFTVTGEQYNLRVQARVRSEWIEGERAKLGKQKAACGVGENCFTSVLVAVALVATVLIMMWFGMWVTGAEAQDCSCGGVWRQSIDEGATGFDLEAQYAGNRYRYIGAGDYPDVTGRWGAVLELAGNDVQPEASRGRAQLISGNVPGGKIGFNVTNSEGAVMVQSAATTKALYYPFYNAIEFVGEGSIFVRNGGLVWVARSGKITEIAVE